MRNLAEKYNKDTTYPIKIVQFGHGNFIRGFFDWIVQIMNEESNFETSVSIVQIHGNNTIKQLNEQNNLFTVFLQGIDNGKSVKKKKIIDCVDDSFDANLNYNKFLELCANNEVQVFVSNTTESGIVFDSKDKFGSEIPSTYPGKLTEALFYRYKKLGDKSNQIFILPLELNDNNGQLLKDTIIKYSNVWGLEDGFFIWLEEKVDFYNTLVDRIISGFPKNESQKFYDDLGYRDPYLVVGEFYHSWYIQGNKEILKFLPLDSPSLNVELVEDIQPYRLRKVRILNGAHTALAMVGLLQNIESVGEAMDNSLTFSYIDNLIRENIAKILPFEDQELNKYIDDIYDRFRNPYIKHELKSIALNSVSKFRTRDLPSLLEYFDKFNELPKALVLAFASLILFYKGNYRGRELPISDDEKVINFFYYIWDQNKIDDNYDDLVEKVLNNEEFWGQDLNKTSGLRTAISDDIEFIEKEGIDEAIRRCLTQ